VSGVILAPQPKQQVQMLDDDLLGLSASKGAAPDLANLIELPPDVRGQGVKALLKFQRGHDLTSPKRSVGSCATGWGGRR
jgi:hypothetical protein